MHEHHDDSETASRRAERGAPAADAIREAQARVPIAAHSAGVVGPAPASEEETSAEADRRAAEEREGG